MEEMDFLVLSRQDFKIYGFMDSAASEKGTAVAINKYKDTLYIKPDYKKEVFEELLSVDFGKKDFYYESKTWGFIVDAIEKKLREVLQTIKKVPEEHQQNPLEYLKAYKSEHFDPITNRALFHEDIRAFLGEFYHYNNWKNNDDTSLPPLQMLYDKLKKNYEEGQPLYISVATVEDQKKYP